MKLGDIARESRETYKGDKTDIPIVGLEHLISGELRFNDYEVNTDNTFTKVFHKGQILFGRRRAYLKKAAIAEFDGICSGDITVIEAIPGKVDARLLPFIIQNDRLFAFAVSRSAGGLSPRVKWEHLADYELELPSIEEQRVLADKLWAAYELKEAYKKMIAATDEMVKSQFIEMFGDYEMTVNFGDLFSSVRNGANIKQGAISGGIPITRIETISEGEVNRDKMGYAGIVDNTYSSYYLQDGDILVSHINSIKHIGKCALYQRINDEIIIHGMNLLCLRPYKDIVHPQYLTYLLKSSIMRKLILDITKPAVNQASFTVKDLCKLKVMLPPMSEQEEFVDIVKQADKSKFELQQAIEKIDKVMKSLLQ